MSNIIELKPKPPMPTYKVIMRKISMDGGTEEFEVKGFPRLNGPWIGFVERNDDMTKIDDMVTMIDAALLVRMDKVTVH